MSGGEYTTFTGDKGFEQRVVDAARRTRNRYLITFSPPIPLRPSCDPGKNRAGLRRPDRGAGELLAGGGAVIAISRC